MSNFGKLIISKFDDDYKTFHKLNLILVKGNRNAININHNIGKIVINGHSNKVFIKARSHYQQQITYQTMAEEIKFFIEKMTKVTMKMIHIFQMMTKKKKRKRKKKRRIIICAYLIEIMKK